MTSQNIIQEQLKIIEGQLAREKLLRRIGQLMNRSLDIDLILKKICQEIREFLNVDRVCIFMFEEDSDHSRGSIVIESKIEALDSVIGLTVEDSCFSEHYSSQYFLGKYCAINNIHDGDLDECHKETLVRFGIRSNLVVSIANQGNLWGLFCVNQCFSVRDWKESEIDLVQQLVNHLVVIIERAALFEQLKTEVHQLKRAEAVINKQATRERLSREIEKKKSNHEKVSQEKLI